VSRRRRPVLSDRYFFVTVRLLKKRAQPVDADFPWLALAYASFSTTSDPSLRSG
jgi:hypothetical protein